MSSKIRWEKERVRACVTKAPWTAGPRERECQTKGSELEERMRNLRGNDSWSAPGCKNNGLNRVERCLISQLG